MCFLPSLRTRVSTDQLTHLLARELKQECAQSHRPCALQGIVLPTHTQTHTQTHTHRQQRPLLSLFLLPAECRLRLFCKFMLTFESTPPAPVHRSSNGCMNYHIPLYNMIFSSESDYNTPYFPHLKFPPVVTVLMHCLHCVMEEILHHCQPCKAKRALRPAATLFQDAQMRGSADEEAQASSRAMQT